MAVRLRRRITPGRFIAPAASLTILGYFLFHAFSGQYGIRAQIALDAQKAALQTELAALEVQRDRLKDRVALLREGTIERDMLDEQARRQLNLVHADETVILLDQ